MSLIDQVPQGEGSAHDAPPADTFPTRRAAKGGRRALSMARRRLVFGMSTVMACVVASLATPLPAAAQPYPKSPIRLFIPYAPGGSADVIGRHVAEGLSRRLGQPVIVENRPGAAGAVAVSAAAKAQPDGYTLVLAAGNNIAADPVQEKLPYNPATDLVAVSPVSLIPYLMFANPGFPPNTVQELVASAKISPGKLTFASSGTGGAPHLATELLRSMANIDIIHVPYKGAVPAVTDVVGGQVQFMVGDLNTAMPFVKAGRLKAIASTGTQRMALLPDVPTIAESGYPGYASEGWHAVFAPAKTPTEVLKTLATAIDAVTSEPAFNERIAGFGGRPLKLDKAEFAAYIQAETKKRSELIRANNIVPE